MAARVRKTRKITGSDGERRAAQKRGVGRPPLAADGRPTVKLSFDLPGGLALRFDAAIVQTGDRRSAALREAVEWYCSQAGV